MFSQIMVPVDLRRVPEQARALMVVGHQARMFDAQVTFVALAVDGALSAEEFALMLDEFAAQQAKRHGIRCDSRVIVCDHPKAELEGELIVAAGEIGADLIVMATGKPGIAEYFWPSNGERLAGQAEVSVFLVRDV